MRRHDGPLRCVAKCGGILQQGVAKSHVFLYI